MHLTHNPPGWPRPKGYSNAVSASGRMIFIAGQVGWNGKEEFETGSFAGQTRQALENVCACLKAAGARPEHLVRMTWYVTSRQEYMASLKEIGRHYRNIIGPVWPAMSLIEVKGLAETGALIEIEATAVVP